MITEEFEFRLTQWVDGNLSADEGAAVAAMVAADAQLRRLADHHRALSAALTAVPPMPGLDWDQLAGRISDAVQSDNRPSVVGRIGRSWAVRSAVAAVLAVAVTIGVVVGRHGQTPATEPSVTVVTGPTAEVAAGPVQEDITIGPSPALTARGATGRYADGVVSRPATAIIVDRFHHGPAVN